MTHPHESTSIEELLARSQDTLTTLGTVRLTRPATAPPPRRIPSFYADPASWTVLAAVDRLIEGRPDVLQAARTTALILISTYSTVSTMSAIAAAVPSGRVSPLRFAGANAGGPLSLVCMVHGLRGPTLVLTTEPAEGVPAAVTMARHWLRTASVSHVVLAVHDHDPQRGHHVHGVLIEAARGLRPAGAGR
ncbi:hypothetical protein [Actinoalloteichus hymeniacidonis]|uniref:Uncharacterized protein n=1 Tax=Actinoalloteichus hymeniacidonis TaxID=340345 RepID=A0AAC9HMA8_9PSEU|nr:hypothetical protein [Actinoalloteichus hymeniacidonis]AOS61838.1 hypothetical protein TL08_05050 [Actinoalloteichus hymeniacidonis]MBB5910142.1 hypothetical protein [Actinoalloteichus hymeniacidonis]